MKNMLFGRKEEEEEVMRFSVSHELDKVQSFDREIKKIQLKSPNKDLKDFFELKARVNYAIGARKYGQSAFPIFRRNSFPRFLSQRIRKKSKNTMYVSKVSFPE